MICPSLKGKTWLWFRANRNNGNCRIKWNAISNFKIDDIMFWWIANNVENNISFFILTSDENKIQNVHILFTFSIHLQSAFAGNFCRNLVVFSFSICFQCCLFQCFWTILLNHRKKMRFFLYLIVPSEQFLLYGDTRKVYAIGESVSVLTIFESRYYYYFDFVECLFFFRCPFQSTSFVAYFFVKLEILFSRCFLIRDLLDGTKDRVCAFFCCCCCSLLYQNRTARTHDTLSMDK